MKKKYLLNGATPPTLPGVKVSESYIEFDDTYSDDDISAIREKIGSGGEKNFESGTIKAYTPTDAEKMKIAPHLKADLDLSTFGFYTFIAAETIRDRQGDVLDKSFLEWMGEKYAEGRTLADSHNISKRIGYTYDAKVVQHEQEPNHFQLEVKAYVPPTAKTSTGANAKDEIDAGLLRRVSVSFFASAKYLSSEDDNNPYNETTWIYSRPKAGDRADVMELSVVAMGAQAGARIKGGNQGIEKIVTFAKEEIKMEKYTFKTIGKEVEIPSDVLAILKEADTQTEALKAELKAFQDAASTQKAEVENEFVKLRLLAYPTLKAESEQAKAKNLTVEQLNEEIALLVESKKGAQIDPTKEGTPQKTYGKEQFE